MQTTEQVVSLSGVWEVACQISKSSESGSNRSSDAPLAMSLSDWLLLIPDYEGEPHALERFAAAVRHVARSVDERTLLLALGARLRKGAREIFEHRLHRYSSLEDFLECLRVHFSGAGSEYQLVEELRSAKQREAETVQMYGLRLDRLLTQICTIYEDGADKETIRAAALSSFRRGLRDDEIELRVGACDPKTLDEAIGLAVTVENELRCRRRLVREFRGASWSSYYKRKRRHR